MIFNPTNEQKIQIREWVATAIADGWESSPTYEQEDENRARTLTRDGFQVQVISRDEVAPLKSSFDISGWSPDGLVIAIPMPYSWERVQAAVRRCNLCGAENVETRRYSFAGRCCQACLPKAREKPEYPGWTNQDYGDNDGHQTRVRKWSALRASLARAIAPRMRPFVAPSGVIISFEKTVD